MAEGIDVVMESLVNTDQLYRALHFAQNARSPEVKAFLKYKILAALKEMRETVEWLEKQSVLQDDGPKINNG